MNVPVWVIPLVVGCLGSGGLAAIITVFVNSRNNTFNQMQTIVKTLQDERVADKERHAQERLEDRERHVALEVKHNSLEGRFSNLAGLVEAYQEWSDRVLAWGRAGGPPPEPEKPLRLTLEGTHAAVAVTTTTAVTSV